MVLYPEFEGKALQAFKEKRAEAYGKALEKLGEGQVVITEFLPEHAGATADRSWGTTNIATANTYADVITSGGASIANNRWVVINSITQNSTLGNIDLVRIRKGTAVARELATTAVGLWLNNTGWMDDPVIIEENTNLTIQLAGRVTNASAADYSIDGETFERRGVTVNP